ncbi:MAG: histidine phosphatase family protein [Chloroflexi bacterium]|nr:histidine phosphatase family protein [Chloroflexota bacterium]
MMRLIEHRRHTMRTTPGQHLSQAGVDLARRIGDTIGPFDLIVTSTLPRAYETAIAMGFAVDRQLDELASMPDGIEDEVDWPEGFVAVARALRRDGIAARYCREQARLLRSIAESLPEGGRALVISHGGIVESGTVGCLPDLDYSTWGPACGYCEGVRLTDDGGRFTDAQAIRLDRSGDAP